MYGDHHPLGYVLVQMTRSAWSHMRLQPSQKRRLFEIRVSDGDEDGQSWPFELKRLVDLRGNRFLLHFQMLYSCYQRCQFNPPPPGLIIMACYGFMSLKISIPLHIKSVD